MGRLRTVGDAIASIAIVTMCAVVIGVNWPKVRAMILPPSEKTPIEMISIKGAAIRGSVTAPIAIVMFSDFDCPYSAAFARDVLPGLEAAYLQAGKAFLAFRHYPIEKIHPSAVRAAMAANCAGQQGKFWQMHDLLFEKRRSLDSDAVRQLANVIGLDLGAFATCSTSREALAEVTEDLSTAKRLGLSGTPVFLFGVSTADGQIRVSKVLAGFRPASDFEEILAELEKRLGPNVPAPQ